MGKLFNKAVRRYFAQRMSELTDFQAVTVPKTDECLTYPGERLYRRDRDGITDWISLVTSPKGYNEFSVQCGFSRLARFPFVSMRPSIFDLTPKEFEVIEGFFTLREENEGYCQSWSVVDRLSMDIAEIDRLLNDITEAEATTLIPPLVDSAYRVLLDCGIPVLDSIKFKGEQFVDDNPS